MNEGSTATACPEWCYFGRFSANRLGTNYTYSVSINMHFLTEYSVNNLEMQRQPTSKNRATREGSTTVACQFFGGLNRVILAVSLDIRNKWRGTILVKGFNFKCNVIHTAEACKFLPEFKHSNLLNYSTHLKLIFAYIQ